MLTLLLLACGFFNILMQRKLGGGGGGSGQSRGLSPTADNFSECFEEYEYSFQSQVLMESFISRLFPFFVRLLLLLVVTDITDALNELDSRCIGKTEFLLQFIVSAAYFYEMDASCQNVD